MTGTVCVSVIQEEKIVEWKIDNFLQIKRGIVSSPNFSFSDAFWGIDISHSDQKVNSTDVYIALRLYPMSLRKTLTVNMTIGFKTVNGESDLEDASTRFLDQNCTSAFYRPEVTSRSELIRRKSELLPSGTLTVICTLKKIDPNFVKEHKFLDATAQTEENTGVTVLQRQFKEILQNGTVSDVVLKVEGQEFKSHRCVLAARSPVFLAMLTHDTKEKSTGVVDINDADTKIFPDFLHYLYTGSEEIVTSENVVELYTAADKYQVDELKKSCLDYMLTNISVDNFCDILSLSLVHIEKNLTDACSEFFIKYSLPIAETSKWLVFATKNPVAANELNIKFMKNNTK